MRYNVISVDEYGLTKLELDSVLKTLNINIFEVRNEDELLDLIKRGKFEINALIWTMNNADSDCFDIIRKLKRREPVNKIPVIIMSIITDRRYIIKSIESGAEDYIAKPYDETTVRGKLCKALNIPFKDMKIFDEDVQTFSFSDMLNREIKAAGRGNHSLTLLLVSIVDNGAKNADTAEIGELLPILSRLVKVKIRETDTCFLYGDDSLVILLPFADKAGAEVIIDKINNYFRTNSVIKQKNTGYKLVTASLTYPDDGRIKENLLNSLEERYRAIVKRG